MKFQINEEHINTKILKLNVEEEYIDKIFDEKHSEFETTHKKIESCGNEEMLKEMILEISNLKDIFLKQLSEATREIRENYFIDNIICSS